jgi:hypothetical protein
MQSDLILDADLTRAQLAERTIQDAAPLASYSIVDLAVNSEDEAIRLKAAMYVLDRELGKPKTTTQLNLTQTNPVLNLIEGVIVQRGTNDNSDSDSDPTSPYPQSTTVIDQAPASGPFSPRHNPNQHNKENPTE